MNARCRVHNAVENDSHSLADIGLSELCPLACAVAVHRHAYLRTAELVELVLCVCHHIAFHRSATVGCCYLKSVEFVNVLVVYAVCRLSTPKEFQVCRKNLFSQL